MSIKNINRAAAVLSRSIRPGAPAGPAGFRARGIGRHPGRVDLADPAFRRLVRWLRYCRPAGSPNLKPVPPAHRHD